MAEASSNEHAERGSKIGRLTWVIEFYREPLDGMLRAVFRINGKAVVGLDYHRNTSLDARRRVVPPGHHWDVYSPFLAVKDKFPTELPSLVEAARLVLLDRSQIDRADRSFLATICKFWHLRFEREPRGLLKRGRK